MNTRQEQFIQLQLEWYEKLRLEGFKDVENLEVLLRFYSTITSNEPNRTPTYEQSEVWLKIWHHCYFSKRYSVEKFKIKQKYYQSAGMFLHDYAFKSSEEMRIWEFHSEGKSVRKIAEKVGKKACQIHKIIVSLRREMYRYLRKQESEKITEQSLITET